MPVRNTSTYLAAGEVAQLLGFSVRWVTLMFTKWQESGGLEGLPGFKVGKCWRAERKDIEAVIEKLKTRPAQATEAPLRQAR